MEAKNVLELDLDAFSLNDYDNARIEMPLRPSMCEEDVNAQLLEYAISTGAKVSSVDELDEAWVRSMFDGLNTVDEVRQAIVDEFDKELEQEYVSIKYQKCCEALVARLEGEVPDEVLAANIEQMRENKLARIKDMNMSYEQYLREEHVTPDQFDDMIRDETLYMLRLNAAIDLLSVALGTQVGNDELTEYLTTPDPEKFLAEIREKGMVEQARLAAKRVKTMRRVMDTAIINGGVEEKAPEKLSFIKEEGVDFDDIPTIPLIKDATAE